MPPKRTMTQRNVSASNAENPTSEVPPQIETRGRGRPARAVGVSQPPITSLAPTTEADFRGAIVMLTQLVAAQSGNQGSQAPSPSPHEPTAATRLRDFLRMNPPVFTGSKVEEDPQYFIDEMWKVLKAMHATETEGVELAAYQLKDVANIWYNQWEESRGEDAESAVWDEFKSAFLDHFFPQELREAKIEEFMNLKQEGMTVKEYSLKFIQLSRYAPEMVQDMRARMRKFVSGLGRHVKKECKVALLIPGMDISRVMVYAQQTEEDMKRDKEEHLSKKSKLAGPEPSQPKQSKGDMSYFQKRSNNYAPSSVSAPAPTARYDQKSQGQPNFRAQGSQSQASVTLGLRGKPPCGKCDRMHLGECRYGGNGCYKCGQTGHFQRVCLMWVNMAQSSTTTPPARGNQRDAAPGAGNGTNRLYVMGNQQDQEVAPDVVMGCSTAKTKNISYSELRRATNNFHQSNKIGRGGFGIVYKGTLKNGMEVAVKTLSAESRQGLREFLTEIETISDIRHPNLVELIGYCLDGNNRILVYEYLENRSLDRALFGSSTSNVKLEWDTRASICLGTGTGLAFLHEELVPHIVHRDIKASNILLDKDYKPKIGDFGLAKLFPDNITHITTQIKGTTGYLAPEYVMGRQLTSKADVYSFGVLILEIVSGRSSGSGTWQGQKLLLESAWQFYEEGKLLELVDPEMGDFPEKEVLKYIKVALFCTQENANRRPMMSQVLDMLKKNIRLNEKELTPPGFFQDSGGFTSSQLKLKSSESSTSHQMSSVPLSITQVTPR